MEVDATGVGAATVSEGTTCPAQLPWQDTCARARVVAAQLQRDGGRMTERELEPIAEELLALGDSRDPLTAFLVLPTIRSALFRIVDRPAAAVWVRKILERPPSSDPAKRLQLLRQLIRRSTDKTQPTPRDYSLAHSSGSEEEDREEDSSDEEGSSSQDISKWYLQGILENVASFADVLENALNAPEGHFHVAHETLVCLTDVLKRASHEGYKTLDLWEVIERTVQRALLWDFGSGDVPTFIACDVIDLIIVSRSLDRGPASQSLWAEVATAIIKKLSTVALELLLDESVTSDEACAQSFVSTTSSYPLVQKWTHLCSITASTLVSLPEPENFEWAFPSVIQLPTRTRLLAVLAEQDDILIDVVIELLTIHCSLGNQSTRVPTTIRRFIMNELHPDLIFADLLRVFGDDHLVVLDMIMSSETRMLEYLLQYLRHTTREWPQTGRVWTTIDRKQAVMSVLIRLRMEIERLVEVGMFPYNPMPLLRRLEALEDLYENDDS